jgi:hypothetical protein
MGDVGDHRAVITPGQRSVGGGREIASGVDEQRAEQRAHGATVVVDLTVVVVAFTVLVGAIVVGAFGAVVVVVAFAVVVVAFGAVVVVVDAGAGGPSTGSAAADSTF